MSQFLMKQTSCKINKYTDGLGEIWNQICLIFLILFSFKTIQGNLQWFVRKEHWGKMAFSKHQRQRR